MSERLFRRYVAIGDSSTEGLDDPDGEGGFRGWADRLAERIAAIQGSLMYANLGIRGRLTRDIRDEQLEPALAMSPDLVTLFSGTNDIVRRSFDLGRVAADIEYMQRALIDSGAVVLTFTLVDLTPVMPIGRLVAGRLHALNDALRRISAASGARLVDFDDYPVATDPRLWSRDRLHANSTGHDRIAAALAQALDLPGADSAWSERLPPLPRRRAFRRFLDEAEWSARYLVPWLWRHVRGRSSGDGRTPKRRRLERIVAG